MHETADLQDKMGQGEVDTLAREMLADMLLELKQPQDALSNTNIPCSLAPIASMVSITPAWPPKPWATGPKPARYYTMLLEVTDNGIHSTRSETVHAKAFLATGAAAAK